MIGDRLEEEKVERHPGLPLIGLPFGKDFAGTFLCSVGESRLGYVALAGPAIELLRRDSSEILRFGCSF